MISSTQAWQTRCWSCL